MASGSVVEGQPGTAGCVGNACRAARHAAIAIYNSGKTCGLQADREKNCTCHSDAQVAEAKTGFNLSQYSVNDAYFSNKVI